MDLRMNESKEEKPSSRMADLKTRLYFSYTSIVMPLSNHLDFYG